jgi:hypothetical protein
MAKDKEPKTPPEKQPDWTEEKEKKRPKPNEEQLDEALLESFPASDPISMMPTKGIGKEEPSRQGAKGQNGHGKKPKSKERLKDVS